MPTALPNFLARLPESATKYDHSGLTSFNPVVLTSSNPVGDNGIYLLRAGGLRALSSLIPGVGLVGLVPRTESTSLGKLAPRTESTSLSGLVPLAKSLSWVGSCPGLTMLSWVFFSALPHITIFTHTSHV